MERVTATEVVRRFSDLLNRVRYRRESFVITRNGEEVGLLLPPETRTVATLGSLVDLIRREAGVDTAFGDDVEAVREGQPPLPEGPWHS